MFFEVLKNGLSELGINTDEVCLNKFDMYKELLKEWNNKINLTSILEDDDIAIKHFVDSLSIESYIKGDNVSLIDIGTGAGFPGVVLYLLNPNADITLLDSTAKKINLLKDYALDNGYNYQTVVARAEDYARNNREQYDYVFARAVAPLNILLELAIPLLKVGGTFIALKGPGVEEEITQSQTALKKLNARVGKIIVDGLPESSEARNIVYIIKDKQTNKKYPRDYKDIKNLPL